jgi:monofunctional biosynthetic peptidoglycan transglycosylase
MRTRPDGTPSPIRRYLRIAIILAILLLGVLPLGIIITYRFVDPPFTPLMLVRSSEGHGRGWRWTDLDDLPSEALRGAIASEDLRFCKHWGIDVGAVEKAIEDHERGAPLRGASTITMQVTRNVLLWQGRSYFRKGLEALYAPVIDLIWGKDRVIEIYLNIAEWGPGIYGIEAAARAWFGKPALELSREEVTRLFAILPSPLRWDPRIDTPDLRHRRRRIGRAMRTVRIGRDTVCP